MSVTYLPHINRDLTTLPNDTRRIWPLHPLLEVRENLGCRDTAKGFCSLVSDHIGFVGVLEDLQ